MSRVLPIAYNAPATCMSSVDSVSAGIRRLNVVQNRNLDGSFVFLQAQAEFGKGCFDRRIHRILTVCWQRGRDAEIDLVPALQASLICNRLRGG